MDFTVPQPWLPFIILGFIFLLVILAGRMVMWVTRGVNYAQTHWFTLPGDPTRRTTIVYITGKAVRIGVWVAGFIIIGLRIGIPPGAMTVFGSVLGAGIGFGSQTLFADIIKGVRFILERHASVGDIVSLEISGATPITGTVSDISVGSLKVVTEGGETIVCPHHSVVLCRNLTDESGKFTVNIPVSSQAPIDEVITILTTAVDDYLADDSHGLAELVFRGTTAVTPGAVSMQVYGSTVPGEQFAAKRSVQMHLVQALQSKGISLAEFPGGVR